MILNPDKLALFTYYDMQDEEIDDLLAKAEKAKKPSLKLSLTKKARRIASEKLDIIGACRAQFKDNSAFEYYFNTISGLDHDGATAIETSADKKTCGNCAYWPDRKEYPACVSHIHPARRKETLACSYWEHKDWVVDVEEEEIEEEKPKKKKKSEKDKKKKKKA